MIRWPAKLIDRKRLDAFLHEVDCAELRRAGQNLILDIAIDEVESEDWDDRSGWLAALAPLRTDVIGGDLRLFYLLWLSAVEANVFRPDEPEPMPGIGPMTGALEAFADFFHIDRDLVAAASERAADPHASGLASSKAAEPVIAAMSDLEKTGFLARLFDGDAHVGNEFRALVRHRLRSETDTDAPQITARTVGDLRARAQTIRQAREHALAKKATAERKRHEEEAERSRRVRLDDIARQGESVWREVETEIERRNASGYDKATNLIRHLMTISREKGTFEKFSQRLQEIRDRHARKERLIERLVKLG